MSMNNRVRVMQNLNSGALFKRNERDYSMFWIASFGDAHSQVNSRLGSNTITLALVVYKNFVSSYYRLAKEDEDLITAVVSSFKRHPELKEEVFSSYSNAGDRLLEMYEEIETSENFSPEFIRELSAQMNKMLVGQIFILHRSDSFVKNFGQIPGLPEEVMQLRKKHERVFGLFETQLEKLFGKVLPKVKGAHVSDFKLLYPEELIQALESGVLPEEKIKDRKDLSVMSYLPSPELFTGDAAKEVCQEIVLNESKYDTALTLESEVTGQTVYQTGAVQGVCRVVKDYDQIKNLEEGCILVTPSTLPKYNEIYKKTKAIVTDEGGILSHVAILSREFKIPAVFGTKIATKVFKDGDMVEVDANKGLVRKLN